MAVRAKFYLNHPIRNLEAPQSMIRRYKARCAYDGTDFDGWQSQAGGNTVQDFIERRLRMVLQDPDLRIHGSGRTDSGVHALGQTFHFEARWEHGCQALEKAMLSGLPAGIQVTRIKEVSSDFHARFSASSKIYHYHIHTKRANPLEERYCYSLRKNLELTPMLEAARVLQGKHDFANFSAKRRDSHDECLNTQRHLMKLEIKTRGPRLKIIAQADGFLYKMVRCLVGALLACGLLKCRVDEISSLVAGSRSSKLPYQTVPPHGLCLQSVQYL